jgi:hypothetical protein
MRKVNMEICQKLLQETFSYADGNLIWKKPTGKRVFVGQIAGRICNGYKNIGFMGKGYMAHRLIFMFHNGYFPPEVDHVDGNKLNNRIENLRPATHAENLRNQKLRSCNTSGIKNVAWQTKKQRWRVRITVNGKDKHIGYFKDRDLAALVAIEATNLHHKEFSAYKGVLHGK